MDYEQGGRVEVRRKGDSEAIAKRREKSIDMGMHDARMYL